MRLPRSRRDGRRPSRLLVLGVIGLLLLVESGVRADEEAMQIREGPPETPGVEMYEEADLTGRGDVRKLKTMEDAISAAMGSVILQPFLVYNEDTASTCNNKEPWFPLCAVYDGINKDPSRGCNFIRVFKDVMTALWVDFKKTASTTRPMDLNGTLPAFPLRDHRPNPPKQVDRATVYAERPTYYYCYRLILMLYAVSFAYETADGQMQLPDLVHDWYGYKYYMVKYLMPKALRLKPGPQRMSPIAVSLVKDDRMIIVIRGTIWREEWCKDFLYRWSKDHDNLFPGKTHEGMYSVFIEYYRELEEEVSRRRPASILVTGHSLGGGLANMVALRLQTKLDYTPRVDVIGFGSPNTGDIVFAEAFKKHVNSRHLLFLGRGNKPDPSMYTVGDIAAQYTCDPYPGCGVLDTGPFGTFYKYERPHNQVPFYAEEMPNPQKWNDMANIKRVPPSMKGVVATHVCSYMCFTAQAVGDLDSRCHFKDEKDRPDLPESYFCDVSEVPI